MIFLLGGIFFASFLPLFVSSRFWAFSALILQSVLVASYGLYELHFMSNTDSWLRIADLVVMRMIILPLFLIGILKKFRDPPGLELIPENLVSWIVAISFVILSYKLGSSLFPGDFTAALRMGTLTFMIAAAFLILAFQPHYRTQVVALLFFENGIAFLETFSAHPEPWIIQASFAAVFLSLLIVLNRFLFHFAELDQSPETLEPEREVL